MEAAVQEQGITPAPVGAAEIRDNSVISATSTQRTNIVMVRCSGCGVAQTLMATTAEVGEWMPCSVCWRALDKQARLAFLPRFRMLSDAEQRPWRHRFTFIGITEAEMRQEAPQELEAGEATASETRPVVTDAPAQEEKLEASAPRPPGLCLAPFALDAKSDSAICPRCGCLIHEGMTAA